MYECPTMKPSWGLQSSVFVEIVFVAHSATKTISVNFCLWIRATKTVLSNKNCFCRWVSSWYSLLSTFSVSPLTVSVSSHSYQDNAWWMSHNNSKTTTLAPTLNKWVHLTYAISKHIWQSKNRHMLCLRNHFLKNLILILQWTSAYVRYYHNQEGNYQLETQTSD